MSKFKIDLKKIINIKSLKELGPEYNKPIFKNNYIFHYFILLGNLDGLKLKKFPIYYTNNDNLNGFHLAAKEYNFDILCYLIETYPDYIYNRTPKNETFVYFMPYEEIVRFIKKYPKLDWKGLINNNHINLLAIILNTLKYSDLVEFIKEYKFDISQGDQYLDEIVNNNFMDVDEKIKILDKYSDEEINCKNYLGEGLLVSSIKNDDFEMFKYLLNRNIDIDYYYYINSEYNDSVLIRSIIVDMNNNTYQYSKELIKHLRKDNIKYYESHNKLVDNVAHAILYNRLSYRTLSENLDVIYELDKDILNDCDTNCWNKKNIDFTSPIEILMTFTNPNEYNIYSKILLDNKIKIESSIYDKIVNIYKENKSNESFKKWFELFKDMPKYKENNELVINKYPYVHTTLFDSKIIDKIIFALYLVENYSDLYLPTINSHQLDNLKFDDIKFDSNNLVFNKPLFPFIILYGYNPNYLYIHPYLNNLINAARHKQNKRFVIVFLGLRLKDGLHSNVLIYDFKNMTIERFEPYGNLFTHNDIDLDQQLEEELTWNTGLTYKRPSDFLPYVGFQTISNETYFKNKKRFDLEGYCLAWGLWYTETKLKNPNIDSKVLVDKSINNIISLNIKFNEYIRNYSNKINNYRLELLKSIGISEKEITDDYMKDANYNKIINFILKKFNTIEL